MSAVADKQFQQRMGRLEGLLEEAAGFADPAARDTARAIVQSLLELHGVALARALALVGEAGEPGRALLDAFARDDEVSGLLLLHELHPLDLPTRVRRGLDKARPYLQSHGGDVELVAVVGEVVRLRLQGSCQGCPSSAQTLKSAVEEAVYEAAPEVTAIEVEGDTDGGPTPGLLSLGLVPGAGGPAPPGRVSLL